MKIMNKLRHDKRGVTAIEYGLIAALVAVAAIPALNIMSGNINGDFEAVGQALGSASANTLG